MKKLMSFIKTKEGNEKTPVSENKKHVKELKIQATSSQEEKAKAKPRDIFWDGYSDIGYC